MDSDFIPQTQRYIRSHRNNQQDNVWYDKFFLWKYERIMLLFSKNKDQERRCFHLQVLLDIAYIQGKLEQYDIVRFISPDSYKIAQNVFQNSDGTDETMIPLIDEHF